MIQIQYELFRGMQAVCIETDMLKCIIIPELGGKIASFYHKEKQFELLFQNKDDTYKIPKYGSAFEEFDASGFDDAFPNIDEETIQFGGRKIICPDHGEIWTMPMNVQITPSGVLLSGEGVSLPYTYQKQISMDNNKLKLRYKITNTSNFSFPAFWTMHCLIRCNKKMELFLPTDTVENVLDSPRLGKTGTIHTFPQTTDIHGMSCRLDRVRTQDSNLYEKFYAQKPLTNDKCGVYYPNDDIKFEIDWDKDKLPYVGFWVTEGGFRGDYNCAIEPSSGYYDSITNAISQNKIWYINPKETINFWVDLSLCSENKVV